MTIIALRLRFANAHGRKEVVSSHTLGRRLKNSLTPELYLVKHRKIRGMLEVKAATKHMIKFTSKKGNVKRKRNKK